MRTGGSMANISVRYILIFLLGLSFTSLASALPSPADEELQAKKAAVRELALANTSNVEGLEEVRAQLDQLIGELIEGRPAVTAADWVAYSPGSWRQIWSDEADNSPAGSPPRDLERIFQYVTVEGRAVNFGQRFIGDKGVTFALEAVGSVEGSKQTTKILKAFSRGQGLSQGEVIENLAQDILSGDLQQFQVLNLGEFPQGPINAQSDLTLLYLDEDLKIGTAPNVYSGFVELFVLQRQALVQ